METYPYYANPDLPAHMIKLFRLRSDRTWSSNMLVFRYIGLECLECTRGIKRQMDRRIDGRTGNGRIDGFLYVRLFDRIGG